MTEKVINLFLRALGGAIIIYLVNFILDFRGISSGVGINIYTVLTSGILGFPGLFALYGISFYKYL